MSLARQPRLLCLLCQSRAFGTSLRRLATQPAPKSGRSRPTVVAENGGLLPNVARHPDLENAPRSYGKRKEEFTPTPLARPIGLPYPPEAGQNTGLDLRTVRQRRDDFVDYGQHLDRRQILKEKVSRPYFRDWTNLQHHKGKTFIAPPRPFKGDLSLFFPNLYGQTLSKTDKAPRDTTPLLTGRVSVISIFSSQWAENQCRTFISREHNPAAEAVISESRGLAQHVRINIEEDALKAMVVRWFMGGLRRQVGEENWERYFLVRRGVSDEIRECIGLLNSKVGYTYVVDRECRIRWAGSGPSEEHERDGLVKAVERLLNEKPEKVEATAEEA
ncbi:ATP10 protein-domain-containing protein [Xylariaceae sp. FL0255]|nr:ATP10 protein-domain-containing protein [Xylariaceae sp. FL0255]